MSSDPKKPEIDPRRKEHPGKGPKPKPSIPTKVPEEPTKPGNNPIEVPQRQPREIPLDQVSGLNTDRNI